MRQDLLTYLKGLKLTSFKVSDELPFSSSGTPLFTKNSKVLYVDQPQQIAENVLTTLSGPLIDQSTTTIRVFLTSDAKQLPSTYDAMVQSVKAGRTALKAGYHRAECYVVTTYDNDLLQTEFEFRFTKLL